MTSNSILIDKYQNIESNRHPTKAKVHSLKVYEEVEPIINFRPNKHQAEKRKSLAIKTNEPVEPLLSFRSNKRQNSIDSRIGSTLFDNESAEQLLSFRSNKRQNSNEKRRSLALNDNDAIELLPNSRLSKRHSQNDIRRTPLIQNENQSMDTPVPKPRSSKRRESIDNRSFVNNENEQDNSYPIRESTNEISRNEETKKESKRPPPMSWFEKRKSLEKRLLANSTSLVNLNLLRNNKIYSNVQYKYGDDEFSLDGSYYENEATNSSFLNYRYYRCYNN